MAGYISASWILKIHWLNWWQLLFILVVIVGLVVVAYFAMTYAEASLEVKAQPREPMHECTKHGLFRKKHLIKFLDNEWCPRCFDERVKTELDSSVIAK